MRPIVILLALLWASHADAQLSAEDRQLGATLRVGLLARFGGAYTGPGSALVQRVGRRVAVASGISADGADCTVTLLNSPIANAFATPGCYIYTTRGMLAVLNDEAELAMVLGHEIGHVAAHHAQARQQRASLAGLGALAASVLTGSAQVAEVAGGLGLRSVLAFSRDQEYEADGLGLEYMARAGYATGEGAATLQALADNDALQARLTGFDPQAKIPSWARSHPLTADRIARVADLARDRGHPDGRTGHAEYLAGIDGMLWGDDPEQGFIEGRTFAHPKMRIAFTAPPGFVLQNSPAFVDIVGAAGRARFGGGAVAPGEDLGAGLARIAPVAFGRTAIDYGALQRLTINGIDAVVLPVRRESGSGAVDLTLALYRTGPREAYYLATMTPAGQATAFDPLINSFRRLSAIEAAALRARVLRVGVTDARDTLGSLADHMAFADRREERFLALNGLPAGKPLAPGTRVKLIEYAPR